MAAFVMIDDPSDGRLADYVRLTDVELRRRHEPAAGLFIAEGDKVIRRAVAAGYPVRSVLLAERWLDSLHDLLEPLAAPVYVAPDDVLAAVTGFDVHRGALAAFARRALPSVAELAARSSTVAVLEEVNDHTNVGLIFRSAAALGVDAAVLAPRCADPLYRRAVKTSMGGVFVLPYARMSSWYDGLAELTESGFTTVALTPDPAAATLDEALAAAGAKVAILLGSEGDGLSPRWRRSADVGARIPMAPGVDSLNVAAAAAIAFYLLGRKLSAYSRPTN